MILGVGIDLVEVDRIASAFARRGARFGERVFADEERAYCSAHAVPWPRYAARFAAKEAFAKALGLGIAKGLNWRDVVVRTPAAGGDDSGPRLELRGKAARLAAERGVRVVHLSLSHTRAMASAVVVLEGDEATRTHADE